MEIAQDRNRWRLMSTNTRAYADVPMHRDMAEEEEEEEES